MYGDLAGAIKATPSSVETLSGKFKSKSWIDPNANCSEDDLICCALERIKQDPKQFPVFVSMLRETPGMIQIADKVNQRERKHSC